MAKAQWTRPQLIVLARGTPDENVLTHCKFIGAGEGGGANTSSQNGCNQDTTANCGVCQARAGS